ncbi:MAG: hypothetical protein FJX62_18765 [Alphaproteobacteria bacterium]|nr:hypothetical protein [Alphaproteobacteria bacterium]
MSAALDVYSQHSNPSLGRQWVLAHVGAQVVFLAAAGIAYLSSVAIGAEDPAAGVTLKRIALGLTVAADVIFALAFAWMRGAVLQVAVPKFPMTLWMIVVTGYMSAFFVLGNVFGVTPAVAPPTSIAPTLFFGGLMAALIAGALLGAVFGTVEALVIRRAAQGALLWVVWMAAAYSVDIAVLYSASVLALQTLGATALTTTSLAASAALVGVMKIFAGLILALVTLPALKALRPHHQVAR